MGTKIFVISFFLSTSATAGEAQHSAPGKLNLTYYSHSTLKDKTICEGSAADKQLKHGGTFESIAVKMGELPKTVALHPKHNAGGCTINFTSGPFAGKSTKVGDENGNDTIDVAIDTTEAKNKKECQKILQDKSSGASMGYTLSDCPGPRGTKGSAPRKPGAT